MVGVFCFVKGSNSHERAIMEKPVRVSFQKVEETGSNRLISQQFIKSRAGQGSESLRPLKAKLGGFQYWAMPLDPMTEPSGVLKQQRLRLKYGSQTLKVRIKPC